MLRQRDQRALVRLEIYSRFRELEKEFMICAKRNALVYAVECNESDVFRFMFS